jgi:hypothetical protein
MNFASDTWLYIVEQGRRDSLEKHKERISAKKMEGKLWLEQPLPCEFKVHMTKPILFGTIHMAKEKGKFLNPTPTPHAWESLRGKKRRAEEGNRRGNNYLSCVH